MALWGWEELLPAHQPPLLTKLLLCCVTTAIIALWVNSQRRLSASALRLIPGPAALPVIGNLLEILYNNFEIIPTLQKIAKRYDGIYKFEQGADTMIMLSKPEYLQVFYTSKACINRSLHYKYIGEAIGDCLFVAGGSRWKRLRELATNAFFCRASDMHLPAVLNEEAYLLQQLTDRADGTHFSSEHVLNNTMIRSLNQNLLGQEVTELFAGFMNGPLQFCMKTIYQRMFYIHYHFDTLFRLLPVGRRMYSEIDAFNKYLLEIVTTYRNRIADYKARGEPLPDLYIYKLLDGSTESDADLANEIKIMFFAGVDTSVGTMAFALECLGQFPEIQQKVLEEDSAIQQRLAGRRIQAEDLLQYQYLDRVIKETLRMFPVGPLIGRKSTEDTYIGKYFIPKGTNVTALQIVCNYDEGIFENPHKFDPDRFEPANIHRIPPYAFNPFSAGPRGCPGARYANMSMKIYLSAIVRNFIILPGYSSLEEAYRNTDAEITLKDKNDHPIRLLPRT